MSFINDLTAGFTATQAPLSARLAFLRRTYLHLTGAVGLFVAASWAFQTSGVAEGMINYLTGGGRGRWLLFLGAFMVVGWMASSLASSRANPALQYLGLIGYAVAEALIFAPLIFVCAQYGSAVLLPGAGITGLVFGGLTFFVLTTKKDFSFLGPFLFVGGLVALGLMGASWIFGFNLGLVFISAMILFACGTILYDTSKLVHVYRTDQHVAAALHLFASVMLLLYYVLMLLLRLQRR